MRRDNAGKAITASNRRWFRRSLPTLIRNSRVKARGQHLQVMDDHFDKTAHASRAPLWNAVQAFG